jgi:hypothetical protein
MEGYPLRYAWFAVVSLYTTPQELPGFFLQGGKYKFRAYKHSTIVYALFYS